MDKRTFLKGLLEDAELILKSVPQRHLLSKSRERIFQKGHQSKTALSQVMLLEKEHKEKINKATSDYNKWFLGAESFLRSIDDSTAIKKLAKSRTKLLVEDRIKEAVRILKEVSHDESNQKNSEISALKSLQLEEIINRGENEGVEFKASLRWDYKLKQVNKELEISVAKTVCAMLNSKGGLIFIGVSDDKSTIGIEKDYETLRKQNSDGFMQYLVQVISNYLGVEYSRYISFRIHKLDGKEICVVSVSRSVKPAFVKYSNREEFYIRMSSTSQPLNVKEAIEYIKINWKQI